MAIYDGKILAKRAREEKTASDNIEALESYQEMAKVLAVIRATAMDAGAYLVVQRKLHEATLAVYQEGVDDGYRLARNGED